MKEPKHYKGQEQTYLKHFFLEKYLERVAYNIGWTNSDFVYVDGFSGPWRSKDEELEDTSFMIAMRKLREVRSSLSKVGKPLEIRCVFVEKNAEAYERLVQATESITDIRVDAIHGRFEEAIPEVCASVGGSFALTFIDPTGWTGFSLEKISPLLQLRGEVMINFMFEHIRRFLGTPEIADSFNRLFGGPGWDAAIVGGEEATVELYRERIKELCEYSFATHTRILQPLSQRTYFYLVYATRHPKGLMEFRASEKGLLEEQENVRAEVQQSSRIEKTHQAELFSEAEAEGPSQAFLQAKENSFARAEATLLEALGSKEPRTYESVLPAMLEHPFVHEVAAKDIMMQLLREKRIRIDGLIRRPSTGCTLSLLA